MPEKIAFIIDDSANKHFILNREVIAALENLGQEAVCKWLCTILKCKEIISHQIFEVVEVPRAESSPEGLEVIKARIAWDVQQLQEQANLIENKRVEMVAKKEQEKIDFEKSEAPSSIEEAV